MQNRTDLPWHATGWKNTVVCDAHGYTLALYPGTHAAPLAEVQANARLIAAAPDLLAALKDLLPMWESGIREPWVQAARDAIAKAEGQP